jgi:hypothetical protein
MRKQFSNKATADYIGKMPFRMANILGRQELHESRMTIFFIVVVFTLVISLVVFGNIIFTMRSDVADARANQKVHVYPEGDGVFVERRIMPETHILGFVNSFENLYFNWAPESVRENMIAAEKMMSQDFIFDNESIKNTHLKHGSEQRITQVVSSIPSEPNVPRLAINKLSHGYEVVYAAKKRRSVRGEVFSRSVGKIRLIVQRVEPNAHYAWGLRVVKITEEWISETL